MMCLFFSSLKSQRHYCAFLYTVSIRKGCFSKVSQLLFKGKRAKTHRLFLEGGLLSVASSVGIGFS